MLNSHSSKILLLLSVLIYGLHCSKSATITLYDYKNEYVWVGEYKGEIFQFEIDSVYNKRWYLGNLIWNGTDTFNMSGFQKGSNYPSNIFIPRIRDTFSYSIHFWANRTRDTLISRDFKSSTDSFIVKRNNYVDVPEGVIFIRKNKN